MPAKKKASGKYLVSLSEMSQEIDLETYLGYKPKARDARLFAELAIETIKNRTLDGQTINGGKFKKYSKKYADFKGVTQDSVDLFLEGDMLNSLDYEVVDNKPKIYLDDTEVPKGYNHNVGDTLPKRPWFGLTDSEAQNIAESIKETPTEKKITLTDLRNALAMLGIEQTE
jgi:hypothetical protein